MSATETHAAVRARSRGDVSPGAIVLAVAVPPLFLHADYQPSVDLELASTMVTVTLADVAVLAVVVAALLAARAHARRLRPSLWAWTVAASLVGWIVASTLARADTDGYAFADELVTALKFGEYALLAPATCLLLRTRGDLAVVAWTCVAWTAAAACVGVAQLVGVDILDAWTAWRRQPSFVGHHDLAALASIGLALAVAATLLGRRWPGPTRLGAAGGAAGAVALVVSGTLVGAAGVAVGAATATAVAWRRLGITGRALRRVAALVAVVVAGVFLFRGGDVLDFARFLGIGPEEEKTEDVQTYSHRSVLAYIGIRIFLDHPLAGVGWQGSSGERAYGPYVEDARARFPTVADEAFPAPGREWGIQSAYIQAAADLGLPGALLFAAAVFAPLGLVRRGFRRDDPAAAAVPLVVTTLTCASAALWVAQGLVAGIPLAAVTWLTLGLAAGAAAEHAGSGARAAPVRSAGT